MKVLYFTGTGNSLAVAKRIAGRFGAELVSIAQSRGGGAFADDAVGVVFPTYCCNVPGIVRDFLAGSSFEAEYAFAVATYGNGAGRVLELAQDAAAEAGRPFDYLATVLMLDNCQPQFDIARERGKLPGKDVDGQVERILADIAARRARPPRSTVGDRLGTWLCRSVLKMDAPEYARKYTGNYSVDGGCVLCGTCAEVCPMGNVAVTDHVAFGQSCATCQACIHACPRRAIHMRGERSAERWRNPEVSLAEIVAANRQQAR